MRILLSYASEYDKGEGIHFHNVLTRQGHDVVVANVASAPGGVGGRLVSGFPATIGIRALLESCGGADFFLYIEPLGLIPSDLERSPIPTACVISDAHRNLESRQQLARLFDRVFLYHRNYVSRFDEHPAGCVSWFPYACDTEFFKDLGMTRDLDVAFVGQLFAPGSERHRLIGELGARYRMNEPRYYLQREIPPIYSRAKIVINLPLADDLTFRFFEATSCGALLLTRRLKNGQEDLFRENEHYAAFDDDRELRDKIDYYLTHEDERATIAATAHAEVMQHHTLAIRLEGLVSAVTSTPPDKAPARRMTPVAVTRTYAGVYERAGRLEALFHQAASPLRHGAERRLLLAAAGRCFLRRAINKW